MILTYCVRPELRSGFSPATSVFLTNIFLMQSWLPDPQYYFGLVGPAWTLSVELFLYLILPILLVVSKRRWLFGASMLIACVCFHAVANFFYPKNLAWFVSVLPLLRAFDFALGVLAYKWMKDRNFRLSKGCSYLFESLFLGAVAFSVADFAALKSALHIADFGGQVLVEHIVPALGFMTLLIALAGNNGIFSKVFTAKLLVSLSAISCSLYLIHGPILLYWQRQTEHISQFLPGVLVSIIIFTLACSIVTFIWIEDPARKLINHSVSRVLGYRPVFPLSVMPSRNQIILSLVCITIASSLFVVTKKR